MQARPQEPAQETSETLSVFTLLIRCPKPGAPNRACPFAQFRDLSGLEEKLLFAQSLPEQRRREMLTFHQHCLTTTGVPATTEEQLEGFSGRARQSGWKIQE